MSAPIESSRLASLDVFRGATIASMVLVNDPGSWDHIYPPLEHAPWNGWTFTDTVFPFFLWIIGVAMTLSFAKRMERGDDRRRLFVHVLKRAAILYLIGLFLAGFPYFHFSRIRYLGVLPRIALCYLIAASIFLTLRVRGIIVAMLTLLLGYWLLMAFYPVPVCGAGHLGVDCNFARYIDGLVLSGHMWSQTKVWDPEGVISTIPAIATTLFGVLTGYVLRSARSAAEKAVWMFLVGDGLLALGLILNQWLPINKNLWTSTFSIFMAGLASVVFASCYWLVDVQGYRRFTRPFAIYGMNAIAVFVLTGLIGRLLGLIKIGGVSLGTWIFNTLFLPLARPIDASLLYAVANVIFFYLIVYGMYRRGWFLRF
jgi:predicted acyltransferase